MMENKSKEWLVDQYNRNRPFCEQVKTYKEIEWQRKLTKQQLGKEKKDKTQKED